jgi:outer membrane protein assembly factor BamD (BamD/ComL family)
MRLPHVVGAYLAFASLCLTAAEQPAETDDKTPGAKEFRDGNSLMREKKYPEAIVAYKAALAKSPNMPGALYNGGLAGYLTQYYRTAS